MAAAMAAAIFPPHSPPGRGRGLGGERRGLWGPCAEGGGAGESPRRGGEWKIPPAAGREGAGLGEAPPRTRGGGAPRGDSGRCCNAGGDPERPRCTEKRGEGPHPMPRARGEDPPPTATCGGVGPTRPAGPPRGPAEPPGSTGHSSSLVLLSFQIAATLGVAGRRGGSWGGTHPNVPPGMQQLWGCSINALKQTRLPQTPFL